MFTDGAAVMARVANASVSREIHMPDESWLRSIAHQLNNAMKHCMTTSMQGTDLQVIVQDFRGMKKFIEDANSSGWNHLLPHGYKLIQESETRFGTFYYVAERFLRASRYVYSFLDSHMGDSAQAAFNNLRKTSNIDGTITGYPGIEAVFDGFGVVVDCIHRFETSQRPTLHVPLPTIYRMLAKLDDVVHGSKTWRGEDQALAHPSIYYREFIEFYVKRCCQIPGSPSIRCRMLFESCLSGHRIHI